MNGAIKILGALLLGGLMTMTSTAADSQRIAYPQTRRVEQLR